VLSQVKEPRVLYGGGWAEMRMARAIEEAAKKTPGGWLTFCCFMNAFRCQLAAAAQWMLQ
jgi:chaperonin GroEL (HSP60 family)